MAPLTPCMFIKSIGFVQIALEDSHLSANSSSCPRNCCYRRKGRKENLKISPITGRGLLSDFDGWSKVAKRLKLKKWALIEEAGPFTRQFLWKIAQCFWNEKCYQVK
jgi:hypothetical protein